jgi:hypothetical protein
MFSAIRRGPSLFSGQCLSTVLFNRYNVAMKDILEPNQTPVRRNFAAKRNPKNKKRLLGKTVRDRQRQLVETNKLPRDEIFSKKKMYALLNTAENRIGFIQSRIYSFWNQELLKESTEAARPLKPKLVMDTRWWFWNIMYAMLPGLLFALYSELRGKRLMYEFYERQELEQIKNAMGEEFVEANMEKLIPPREEGFVEQASRIVGELFTLFQSLATGERNEAVREVSENVQNTSQPDSLKARGQITVSDTSKEKESYQHSGSDEKYDIQSLLDRIEKLEASREKVLHDERTLRHQKQRAQQSGIHNRFEDQKILEWKKMLELNSHRDENLGNNESDDCTKQNSWLPQTLQKSVESALSIISSSVLSGNDQVEENDQEAPSEANNENGSNGTVANSQRQPKGAADRKVDTSKKETIHASLDSS